MEKIEQNTPLSQRVMSTKKNDDYYTPDYALEYLLPYIPYKRYDKPVILDPACGTGNILRFFERNGYGVVGGDIKTGQDFLDPMYEMPECDIIITNPPFSKKDAFLRKCYESNKPFALLLPLSALGGKTRAKMFAKYGLQLIVPASRVNFVNDEIEDGKSSSWFHTAWFANFFAVNEQLTFVGLDK